MATNPLDPITLQVINGALQTIAEEMGHILYRMSFSSIIRESQDLGAGLFDIDFNTLCESESTPLHIGSLPGYLAGIAETLQDGGWHDGDVVIHNHPYYGSSHSPDIAVVVPVFYDGVLVGFSANTAHHVDIGAATPGLIIDIPDVFAEGMLFAGTKLYERGKRNEALWSFIGRNSRAAGQLQADLDAQIAAARLGAKRFAELMDRYGRQTVLDATQQLMDYTERVLRQRIAGIPDGEYRAEGFLDDDGKNREVRLPVKVCVRVLGDGIEIDLTGSSDQVETAFNVPFEGSTKVACFCAIRSLLLDTAVSQVRVPTNQGSFRPVKVIAPKGSIYNPNFPAAAEARFAQCNRVIDLIYKALAPVLPDEIIAGSSASLSFCAYSGVRPNGNYWVFLEVNEGAYGGRPRSDGPDCIDNLMANTRNNPLEDLAMHLPMICDRYELRDDVMPGAGRFRGGIGVVKAQRMLTDGFITHENERHLDRPWGVFGGEPGQVGRVEIYNVDRPEDIKSMPAKFSGMRVSAGDVHVFYAPCGGGFGDPLERPAAKLLEDVLDGFCTLEHARTAYGVVIDLASETVDATATERLRDQMRSQRQHRRATPIALPATPPPARQKAVSPQSLPLMPGAAALSNIDDVVHQLRAAYGEAWSFEIVAHRAEGPVIEVVGQLRADGAIAREAVIVGDAGCSKGELLERAADESLRKCALALLHRAEYQTIERRRQRPAGGGER
jgi:N-methylhydantoinase B